jgi:hypothetical protein
MFVASVSAACSSRLNVAEKMFVKRVVKANALTEKMIHVHRRM